MEHVCINSSASRAGVSQDAGHRTQDDNYSITVVISLSPPLLIPLFSSISAPSISIKRRRISTTPTANPGPRRLPIADFPFAGDFAGAAWNAQALMASHCGKQHAKMRKAFQLASSHDFLVIEETHSNKGKVLASRIPLNLRAFWSHGSNYQAGLGLLIKQEFLAKFNPVAESDWREIEPGRTAMLRLRGPQGA